MEQKYNVVKIKKNENFSRKKIPFSFTKCHTFSKIIEDKKCPTENLQKVCKNKNTLFLEVATNVNNKNNFK